MRIASVEAFFLRAPLEEPLWWSTGAVESRTAVLVRITTASGLQGWGEAGVLANPVLVPLIVEHLGPAIKDRDARDREGISEYLQREFRACGRGGLLAQAISGIDIAIWDLAGQAAGLPTAKLLKGGVSQWVPAYATGLYYLGTDVGSRSLLDTRREEVDRHLEEGYRAVKMKIGRLSIKEDLHQVTVIRKVIGDDVALMVDANQAYTATDARVLGDGLEHLGLAWFEEPVPSEKVATLRELRRAISTPLAGGELESVREAFGGLAQRRCLDFLQPDLCVVGGFSEGWRVAQLALFHDVRCVPHVWGSVVGLYAAAHFVAAIAGDAGLGGPGWPGRSALEVDRTPNPLREELGPSLPVSEGLVRVPDAPGLGLEIDETALRRYLVA